MARTRRLSSVARPWMGWWAPLVLVVALGCGPSIEDEPPIPEHRIEPCETRCGLLFDPVCQATEVEVETEDECVETCTQDPTRWGAAGEDEDVCAATFIPLVDCLAMLPCDELQLHFDLVNVVPPVERPCGDLLQEQYDCQLPYQ